MKIGGKNFGFGHQFGWAARQALIDRYGDGHYGTVQAHADRFLKLVQFCRPLGVRDARDVSLLTVENYGQYLVDLISDGELAVSYAQNLLSSVNVVMTSFRGDRVIFLRPSKIVGKRNHIRTERPIYISVEDVLGRFHQMVLLGEFEVAAIIRLARFLGLRFRECALLNAVVALKEAVRNSCVSIVRGAKGGRPRQIPVINEMQMEALAFAAEIQGRRKCLIPEGRNYEYWRNFAYGRLYSVGLRHFHDFRAAFACDRYQTEAGIIAPVLADSVIPRPLKEVDRRVRTIISKELGHNRPDILNAYIGAWRT